VDAAKALRHHNQRVLSGSPVTPEEVAAARSAAAAQGHRTAAANRLQDHATATDWDAVEPDPVPVTAPWDDLAADEELPDAL
jgi:hypothetical protein